MSGMAFYNIDDGYLDGIVRGFRSGILLQQDYSNLTQCENLEDMKLHLASTDYGDFLADETGHLLTTTIQEKCTQRLVKDFNHLRAHAVQPLAKFLDYITYGYMIDNIMLLITGTLHERDTSELLSKCSPLGMFESLASLTVANTTISDLYNSVIIDTPLAPYFQNCLTKEDLSEMLGPSELELVRNTLYKAYLEDFYRFCTKELGGVTGEVMGELLEWEADKRTLNITLNSFQSELSKDDREKLYPNFGKLWPETTAALAKVDEYAQVVRLMDNHETYQNMFAQVSDNLSNTSGKTLEDLFYEHDVAVNALTFEQHFQYGIFYAYVKLKEQEIRNIVWIAECIAQNQPDKINQFVPIFPA